MTLSFHGCVQGATLAGLWSYAFLYLSALHTGIHALGHEPHRLSVLGQAFDDHTPLPFLVPWLYSAALASYYCLEGVAPGFAVAGRFRGRRPWLTLASLLGLLAPLTWALFHWDISHIPSWPYAAPDPYRTVVAGLGAGALLSALGVILLMLQLRVAGGLFHCVTPLAFVGIVLHGSARQLEGGLYVPAVFPTPQWVLPALAAIAVLHFAVPRWLPWRDPAEGVLGARILASWGIWNWVVAAAAGIGWLMPAQHLCLHDRYALTKGVAAAVCILAFVLLCAPPWIRAFRRSSLPAGSAR